MSKELSPQARLQILRTTDRDRRWYSVDDKRVCLICERIISGREIRIDGGPTYHLSCPTDGCPGTFSHWFLYRPAAAEPEIAHSQPGDGEMDFLSDFERPSRPDL